MKYFIAIVHKDADSAFGIGFPDLPSVFSAADEESDLTSTRSRLCASGPKTAPCPSLLPTTKPSPVTTCASN